MPDGTILDASWTAGASGVHDDSLSSSEIAVYDAAERPARLGFDATLALADQLPDNADGEKPIVSNVAYYVPYPDDSPAYRAVAWGYIASVPAVFVACLVVAGRLFYRNRIDRPVADMEEAAAKISDGDLDFNMEPQRNDELGRLCASFEDMRAELARSKSEMWRAAENRRRVNAAFAHDLRTPHRRARARGAHRDDRRRKGERSRSGHPATGRAPRRVRRLHERGRLFGGRAPCACGCVP